MLKTSYALRLRRMLWDCVGYRYPETKGDKFPKYYEAVYIESSFIKNCIDYFKALIKFYKMDRSALNDKYNSLPDDASREIMLKEIVYDLFDDVRVRFPLHYYTDLSKYTKSDFLSNLFQLILNSIPYTYPEKLYDYEPDFNKKIELQTSHIVNAERFILACDLLHELDLNGLEWTYDNLADEYSRYMMTNVIVHNLFNEKEKKIRFPLCYSPEIDKFEELEEKMCIDDEVIPLWLDIMKLKKYDLNHIGYNLKIWFTIRFIFIDFIREQYRYKNIVKVEDGDYVIDGGACYGDTALYFAERGAAKVFSFEFLEENLDIFNKNMALNPHLSEKIQLFKNPLGQVSGEKLYAVGNGPGTSVSSEYSEGAVELHTLSIDDLVEQNNIEKIDLIKLDVECSEVPTLKGAINTIRKFKPKLAICVYHKKDDLWTIPQLIKEMLPEYTLYLDHHTINFTETVIYAKVIS